MIIIKVKLKFKDNKVKYFECYETPFISQGWVNLAVISANSLHRKIIPSETVLEMDSYSEKTKKGSALSKRIGREINRIGFKHEKIYKKTSK